MKRRVVAVRPRVAKFTKDEEKQDKRQASPHRQLAHFCPQCGQLTGIRGDLIPEREKGV